MIGVFIKSEPGVSLISVVMILLIIGMIGAVFISLINNESLTAMHQSAGLESFGISEGGLEYGKRYLRPYAAWYSFATDPITAAASLALGSGSFTTLINFPATALSKTLGAGTTKVCVRTKDRFPTTFPFYVRVEDEYMQCTANHAIDPTCYFCTRGQLGSANGSHTQDTSLYPVVLLDIPGVTATDTTVPFTGSPSKFLSRGTILIDDPVNGDEEITYGAIQTAPQAFINCIRGSGAVAHASGLAIASLQSTQQAFLQSTGLRGTVLSSSAQRVLTDIINQ